jgi:hypothetical protein
MNAKRLVITLTTIFLAACTAETSTPNESSKGGGNAPGGGGAVGGDTSNGGDKPGGDKPSGDKPKPDSAITGCDVAPPASLPKIVGDFVVGGSAPTATGGDEKGTWVVTKVTAYLPSSARLLIDVDKSSAEGTGFMKFDGKRFVSFGDTTTTMATKFSGNVVTASTVTLAGTYTNESGRMAFTPECTKSNAENGEPPKSTGFSRVSATEALFLQTGDSQIGEVTLAMTLKKAD